MVDSGLVERTTILVVDDEEPVRRLLLRILTRGGYSCHAAADAREALAATSAATYDLVLCDVGMPETSGIDIARVLLAEFPETAVVMVSGQDDPAVAHMATESGAYGYITKPFTANQILIAVDNALIRRRLERENRRICENLEETVHARTAELREAVRSLERATHELRQAHGQTIELLSRALEYKDEETADHVERVSRYCALLAERFGLDPESLRLATALHDIGKIAVPDRILRKPGPLTDDERQEMQRHAETGFQILRGSGSRLLDLAASVARTHHERFDGSGYPRALSGEAIPIEGRIAAVADVFDALTSDRIYRPAMEVAQAIEIIRAERGRHFDPAVLDAFLEVLDEALEIRDRYPAAGSVVESRR